jgi:hypothetical protein
MIVVSGERMADSLDFMDYSSVVTKVRHLVGVNDRPRLGERERTYRERISYVTSDEVDCARLGWLGSWTCGFL